MNQLWASNGAVRDWWTRPNAALIENLSWLSDSDCFRPKYFAAPAQALMDIPASGFLIATLAFVPGSWIVGMSQVNASALDFQLTDLGTNYKFFSAPLSGAMLANSGGYFGPFWFPEPYMMAGNALLRVEIFNNNPTASANSQLLFHVLEPREV
jgi:hypothetical protein